MTKTHYDTASSSIQNRIKITQKTMAALSEQLENTSLGQADLDALHSRIRLLDEQLERLSDLFDALVTKYLASVKREAETAYGRAA
jgi:hypothetical protein